jgi:parallel beta-helix repeat protein
MYQNRLGKLIGLSVALVLMALAAGSSTQIGLAQGGKTLTVCASGCDFAKIQPAIDAASAGATIAVQTGSYKENLTIRNKDGLTLKGAGADQVTLDGNGLNQQNVTPGILILNSRNITVTGFKITDSRRGLEADDSTLLFIEANTFEDNLGQNIHLLRSQAEIKSNLIQATQFDQGATASEGVHIASSQATLMENVIKDNSDCGVRTSVDTAEKISAVNGSGNTITGNRGGDLCGNLPLALLAQPPAEGTLDQVAVPADAATLQEAVNKVKANGTITLAAGTFQQPMQAGVVQIYKSLKIIGAGADQTVLQGAGPEWTVLNIATDELEVTIEGLKVTGGRRGLLIGTGPMGAVTLRNSKIERNGIGDVKGEGIRIFGQGTLTLDQVSISENGLDGLAVTGQAQATVQNSMIAKNALRGIATGQFSRITIQKNTISDNAAPGIGLFVNSSATIDGNTIAGNVEEGIFVGGAAQAQITNNQITTNKRNSQANCCGFGINLRQNAQATIQGNTISQNVSSGIILQEDSQATIKQNTITSNNSVGIRLMGNSNATIEGNNVTRNVYQGIWADGSARAQITNNQITDTKPTPGGSSCCGSGIVGRGNSQLTIQGNTISKNAEAGIWIGDNAQLTIKQNTISDNSKRGISQTGNSRSTIDDNTITGNIEIGIYLGGSTESTVTNNRINRTRPNAQGQFGRGMNIEGDSKATIRENQIIGNAERGIRLLDRAKGAIIGNTIRDNAAQGILLGSSDRANETIQAEVSQNIVQNNRGCGVHTDNDRDIKITGQNNTISGNTGGNLCGDLNKFPAGFGGGK